ncbi:hypothetical protein [Candidatus Mycobacterium methanotrophicum]|nr:hypothetical protein [Candidatus Mycobacterium methanotrophicum]
MLAHESTTEALALSALYALTPITRHELADGSAHLAPYGSPVNKA